MTSSCVNQSIVGSVVQAQERSDDSRQNSDCKFVRGGAVDGDVCGVLEIVDSEAGGGGVMRLSYEHIGFLSVEP